MNNQRIQIGSILYWCCTLSVLVATTGAAAEEQLTADEIRALLPSNTLSGRNEKKREVNVYHAADGTMEGMRKGKGIHYDSGTWTITDEGQYCRQWERWRAKTRDCFLVYRIDSDSYRLKSVSDVYTGRARVLQGDPKGLKAN